MKEVEDNGISKRKTKRHLPQGDAFKKEEHIFFKHYFLYLLNIS